MIHIGSNLLFQASTSIEHDFFAVVLYDDDNDVIFVILMKQNTRQTLNAKIRQLNSAIDNVSSRLRGGNKTPPIPIEETDPEMEESM